MSAVVVFYSINLRTSTQFVLVAVLYIADIETITTAGERGKENVLPF